MSRIWLKNGRAVLNNGRAVLCATCPCCSYTYYVDHARTTSGDGHAWETAFNTVNAVFKSVEIRNYRLAGCTIYVKIRGDVTYIITGTYKYNNAYSAYVILQPENKTSRVVITTPNLYQDFVNFIVFDRCDITFTGGGSVPARNLKFLSCNIAASFDRSRDAGSKLFFSGNDLVMEGCAIYGEIINGLNYSYSFTYAGVFSSITGLTIKNTSISISMDGASRGMFDGCRVIDFNTNTILEYVTIDINVSFEGVYGSYEQVIAYRLGSAGNVVMRSCTSTRNIIISSGDYSFCRFLSWNGFDGVTFYDCEQDYYETNPSPSSYPCSELS